MKDRSFAYPPPWPILGESDWPVLGENGWPLFGESLWPIFTRKMTPGNSSLTFSGFDAEALIVNVPELAISTGSACTSGAPEPSHVLTAIGLERQEAYSTLRIGIGRFTTEEEIDQATDLLVDALDRLSELQDTY